MSIIGKTQGNLLIEKLHHKDTTKYSYTMYYYQCKCLLCGRGVVLPATNIRLYKDCGRHWRDKLTQQIPYKGGYITRAEISKKTGFQNSYVSTLLKRGFTAEQIVTKTYPRRKTAIDTEKSLAAKELGLKRQTMNWRLKNGWTLKKSKGKYVMKKGV